MLKPITKALILIAVGVLLWKEPSHNRLRQRILNRLHLQGATPRREARPVPATRPRRFALKTPKEKTSYAIGLNIGKNLHRDLLN